MVLNDRLFLISYKRLVLDAAIRFREYTQGDCPFFFKGGCEPWKSPWITLVICPPWEHYLVIRCVPDTSRTQISIADRTGITLIRSHIGPITVSDLMEPLYTKETRLRPKKGDRND